MKAHGQAAAGWPGRRLRQLIDMARRGDNLVSISTDDSAGETVLFAARELGRYLQKISGSPVLDAGGLPVHLTVCPDSELEGDAFLIEVGHDRIVLSGSHPRGVLYAVYSLLEELGCRWVFPGEEEELVPRLETLSMRAGRRRSTPRLDRRGLALYQLNQGTRDLALGIIDWMAKNRLNHLMTSWERHFETDGHDMRWKDVAAGLLPELQRRGMTLEVSEHMTHLFLPPEMFDRHPDWFALVEGVRTRGQICFSNDEAVAYFGGKLSAFAAAHPEIDVIGTWPLDGLGYCECEGCRQPYTAFAAFARWADAVGEVRPGLEVEFLAYKPQTFAVPRPQDRVPENASALVCNRLDQLARDWSARMREARGATYFEYKLADHYHWSTNVWLRPRFAFGLGEQLEEIGYFGVVSLFLPISAWWRGCLNYYFFARSLWQPEGDPETFFEETWHGLFGDEASEASAVITGFFESAQTLDLLDAYIWHGEEVAVPPTEVSKRGLESAVAEALARLGGLADRASEPRHALHLKRMSAYVEGFGIFYREKMQVDNRHPGELLDFVGSLPPDLAPVFPPPDYIVHRFS